MVSSNQTPWKVARRNGSRSAVLGGPKKRRSKLDDCIRPDRDSIVHRVEEDDRCVALLQRGHFKDKESHPCDSDGLGDESHHFVDPLTLTMHFCRVSTQHWALIQTREKEYHVLSSCCSHQGPRHADENGGGGTGTRRQRSQDFFRVTHTKNRKLSGVGPLFSWKWGIIPPLSKMRGCVPSCYGTPGSHRSIVNSFVTQEWL